MSLRFSSSDVVRFFLMMQCTRTRSMVFRNKIWRKRTMRFIFLMIDDSAVIGNIKSFVVKFVRETNAKLEPFALKITTLFYSSAPINRCPLFQHSRRKLVKFGNNRRILTWMTHFDMKNTTKLDQTISSNFLPQGQDVRNIRTYDEMLPDRSFRSSKLIHENPVSRSRKRINRGTVYSLENKIASSRMAFVMSIMGWDSNRWRRR